jgi:MFS family permease
MKRSGFVARSRRLFSDHPRFAWLFAGQGLAYLNIEMWYVVMPLLVLRFSDSPLWMGVISTSGFLPLIIGNAPAGWWVDRSSPKAVMLVSSLARAGLFAGLAVLGLLGALTLPKLALSCLALGFFGVAHTAAKRAMIPRLIGGDDIALANSLDEGNFGLAEMVGTLAGGLIMAATGPYWAMLIQAALLIGNALAVLNLDEEIPARPRRAVSHPLSEGFTFFLENKVRNRALLWTTILGFLVFGASMSFFSFQVFYYGSTLQAGSSTVGWMVFAVSAIGFVGSLSTGACIERFGVGRTMLLWCVVMSAGLFVVGLASARVPVIIGAGLVLAGAKALRGTFSTLLHWFVPRELMGRVGGVFSTFAEGAAVFAALGAGALAKVVGLPATFLIAGLAGVACCLICLASPLRTLNAKVPSEAQDGEALIPAEIASA